MVLDYKSARQIVLDMISYALSKGSPVTDFNVGGLTRTLMDAHAWQISASMASARAQWETALTNFIYNAFVFPKKGGTSSTATLVFSATAIVTGTPLVIPIGTVVKTADGLQFQTINAGTIAVGQIDSTPIQATSLTTGSANNVLANTITLMASNITGVVGCNNALAATGGVDQESDADHQARFALFVSNLARSTVDGLKSGALSVNGVKYAYVLENLGTYAVGEVVFSNATPVIQTRIIPIGTRIATAGGLVFITLEEATIAQGGTTSNLVNVRSLNKGAVYNVAPATIVVLTDPQTEVSTVNNPTSLTEGTDGNLGYIDLYVDDGSGSVLPAVLDEVLKVIEGDSSDRANYPGYRAAGTIINYLTPTIYTTNIAQTIAVEDGVDRATLLAAVEAAQGTYLRSLLMGSPVVVRELEAAALTIPGVKDAHVTFPAANVAIPKDQVAKPGSFTTTLVNFVVV